MKKITSPLPPEEVHRVNAAEGWLELGNMVEASEELDSIVPLLQAHPEVLAVRYKIHAKAKNWPMCEQIATVLTKLVPDHPSGWISLCQCLHFMGRTRESYDHLLSVAPAFREVYSVAYDLGCYACVLGNLPEARQWLDQALATCKDPAALKQLALADPDFKALWEANPESQP